MKGNPPYSVLVIDDHPLFRKGVGQLINAQQDFDIVGEAVSGPEGVDMARSLNPDVILLDLDMKGMHGIQVLKAIKDLGLDSLVVILTVSDTEQDLVAAVRGGADGYLLKDMEPEDLVAKLRRAAKGEVVLNDTLTGMLAYAMREDRQQVPEDDACLTDREQEILALIAEGMSNKLIAKQLGISDGTVKVHVKNLLRKLNLRSRLEAALWALEHGRPR